MILRNRVVLDALRVLGSINVQALRNLCFKNFDGWLLDSEVSHLDVESMEVNTVETVSNVTGELWLTDVI